MNYFLGIDVGTGSARAGLFDAKGRRLGLATHEIKTWRPASDHVEQSSQDIWNAVCLAVRGAVKQAGIDPTRVQGIGFDATCSLVVVDEDGQPVSVSTTGQDEQDVIVWMDHRASAIADQINAGGHRVLRYVGGRVSPEMQTPKLVWLKQNLPESWRRAAYFFDLPDYLTWRATGALTRSLCSTVCKWTYLAHEPDGWDGSYFKQIGLEDIAANGFDQIGTDVQPMGQPVGEGLKDDAAEQLGLNPGTTVSVSIIDAHAGGVGMLGMRLGGDEEKSPDFNRRLALICGTSSCHMAVSPAPRYIDGVWGPYYSAMVPGLWLTEGGQSATGALVDQVVLGHGASSELGELADRSGVSIYAFLNRRLAELAGGGSVAQLTRDLHVCPYFHGNRSPHANPHLRGMIAGLRLSETIDDLALLYLSTLQAIAYGTKHIIETMNRSGYRIDTIIVCGGGTKNDLFIQQHADATGCRAILPQEPEAVLLGSAMLGATAAGVYTSLTQAMQAMAGAESIIEPSAEDRAYHDAKYTVFHRLYEDQLAYRRLMQDDNSF